jgi:FixJ family two-component response regulator
MEEAPRVFIIDDDGGVLAVLSRLLGRHGYAVEAFSTAARFFARPPYDGPACALLDLRLPDLSGLDVQQRLIREGRLLPIVFLSGAADVPAAASAMRAGAVDFLTKPVKTPELLDAVRRALARAAALRDRQRRERDAAARLARLTRREREVSDLVARGFTNKAIAHALGASEKTIKVHRGRAMHKLGVDSVAALVGLLATAEPAGRPD